MQIHRQETVGERVRRLRLEQGLSQADLAQRGMSLSYVSYVERGQRTPSVKALRLLASRLGVSAGYLETGQDAEPTTALIDAELELRLGRPASALAAFRREHVLAGDRSDPAGRVRAEIGIGLALAALERYDEAIVLLEATTASGDVTPHVRPDAYDCLARCYVYLGEPLKGVLLLRECVEAVRASEPLDRGLFVRFSTLLSYALGNLGDAGASHAAVIEAIEQADGLGDIYSDIRVQWSLGRAYGLQGQPQRAAIHMNRAIALLEQTEDRAHLAAAHEVCATALLDDNQPEAARRHLEVADRIFGELGDRTSLGLVAAEWARLELQLGNGDGAREHAVSALRLLRSGDSESAAAGPAWRTIAEIHADLGDFDLAEAAYVAALESLERGAPAKVVADGYRSFADFLAARGRPREALEAMRRATDLVGVVGRVSVSAGPPPLRDTSTPPSALLSNR